MLHEKCQLEQAKLNAKRSPARRYVNDVSAYECVYAYVCTCVRLCSCKPVLSLLLCSSNDLGMAYGIFTVQYYD